MSGSRQGLRGHVMTCLIALGCATGIAFWLLGAGGVHLFGSSYRIKVLLPTAASLTPGARVTMAGADVGSVTSVQRQGIGALVGVEIDAHGVTPIPENSHVQVRQHTPVGENYLSIQVGNSPAKLSNGGVLPMSQADDFVDVDQVLSVLQGKYRQRARQLIQGVGGALQGNGDQLNALLAGASGALIHGSGVVGVLADDRTQVAQLVQQLGDVSAAVGQRGAEIMTVADEGLVTVNALAGRDAALRQLIDQLPATLDQVRTTSQTLSTVTRATAPVLFSLAGAVTALRPGVQLLTPGAGEARSVLDGLGAAAAPLQRVLRKVTAVSAPAARALPEVHQTLCQLNPMIRYLEPYTEDVISLLTGLGSASNSYDSISHLIRATVTVNALALAGASPKVTQAADTLIHAGLISQSSNLSYDPYPKPGQIGKEVATGGKSVIGPAQVPSTGYVYPHIVADC